MITDRESSLVRLNLDRSKSWRVQPFLCRERDIFDPTLFDIDIHTKSNMAPSICGETIRSKRSLLAIGWSVVNILAFSAFITALVFTVSARNLANNNNQDNGYYNQGGEEEERREEDENLYATSRALTFAAIWTAIMSGVLGIFGSTLLGVIMPNGKYYWCCAPKVHKTTPLVLGAFIGALMMSANFTLICSVLFGEFEVCLSKDGIKKFAEVSTHNMLITDS